MDPVTDPTGSAPGSGAAAEMSRNMAACIDAAARYLATEPAAVERALATHQPGRNG